MSASGSSTQDLLLVVGNATLSSPVCDPMITDIAAKHNIVSLLKLHGEAKASIEKPEALSPKALKECQEAYQSYALAIRLTAKNLHVPEGHPLTKATANLQAVEEQQSEVWSQYKKIAKDASPEAKDKLLAEWNTILT